MAEASINYVPGWGDVFDHTVDEVIGLSRRTGLNVSFVFNEVSLTVTPLSLKEEVKQAWSVERAQRAAEYRASPEYVAKVERRERYVAGARETVNELMNTLPQTLKTGVGATVDWLDKYTQIAGDIDVGRQAEHQYVYGALVAAGYVRGAQTGKEFVPGDKRIMGLYIVGQAMSYLKGGCAPHQVLSHFAEQYRAMPELGPASAPAP